MLSPPKETAEDEVTPPVNSFARRWGTPSQCSGQSRMNEAELLVDNAELLDDMYKCIETCVNAYQMACWAKRNEASLATEARLKHEQQVLSLELKHLKQQMALLQQLESPSENETCKGLTRSGMDPDELQVHTVWMNKENAHMSPVSSVAYFEREPRGNSSYGAFIGSCADDGLVLVQAVEGVRTDDSDEEVNLVQARAEDRVAIGDEPSVIACLEFPGARAGSSVAFIPVAKDQDFLLVAAGGNSDQVSVWKVCMEGEEEGVCKLQLDEGTTVASIAGSPPQLGEQGLAAAFNDVVQVWGLETTLEPKRLEHPGVVADVRWLSPPLLISYVPEDRETKGVSVMLWDLRASRCSQRLRLFPDLSNLVRPQLRALRATWGGRGFASSDGSNVGARQFGVAFDAVVGGGIGSGMVAAAVGTKIETWDLRAAMRPLAQADVGEHLPEFVEVNGVAERLRGTVSAVSVALENDASTTRRLAFGLAAGPPTAAATRQAGIGCVLFGEADRLEQLAQPSGEAAALTWSAHCLRWTSPSIAGRPARMYDGQSWLLAAGSRGGSCVFNVGRR